MSLARNISLGLLTLLGLSLLIGRQHFLLGSLLYYLRLPLLVLITLILYMNRKMASHALQVIASVLVGLLLLEWSMVCLQKPDLQSVLKPGVKLRLLTYNVYFKNRWPGNTLKIIKQSKPDILYIQELTPVWNGHLQSQLSWLPYRRTIPMRGTHGLGLFSRYPIRKHQVLYDKSRQPLAQCCIIKIKDRQIATCNTHLASPAIAVENPDRFWSLYSNNYSTRRSQYARIYNYMKENYKTIDTRILAGDLNTMPMEPLYRDIASNWVNSFDRAGVGSQRNFPNTNKYKRPWITLDYIFWQGSAQIKAARVIPGGSSDHKAIQVDVKL